MMSSGYPSLRLFKDRFLENIFHFVQWNRFFSPFQLNIFLSRWNSAYCLILLPHLISTPIDLGRANEIRAVVVFGGLGGFGLVAVKSKSCPNWWIPTDLTLSSQLNRSHPSTNHIHSANDFSPIYDAFWSLCHNIGRNISGENSCRVSFWAVHLLNSNLRQYRLF